MQFSLPCKFCIVLQHVVRGILYAFIFCLPFCIGPKLPSFRPYQLQLLASQSCHYLNYCHCCIIIKSSICVYCSPHIQPSLRLLRTITRSFMPLFFFFFLFFLRPTPISQISCQRQFSTPLFFPSPYSRIRSKYTYVQGTNLHKKTGITLFFPYFYRIISTCMHSLCILI